MQSTRTRFVPPGRKVTRGNSFRSVVFPLGVLAVVIGLCGGLCGLGLTAEDTELVGTINWVVPVTILLGCGLTSYLLVVRDFTMVWSPVPWFLLACAVYYGFGPLVYTWGANASIGYCEDIFRVGPDALLWTHLLNCVCIAAFSAVTYIGLSMFRRVSPMVNRGADPDQLQQLLWVFLGIGVPVKYFVILPYSLGLTDSVLPGFVMSLSAFANGATFLLVYMAVKVNRNYLPFAIAFCGVELVVGFLNFAKLEVLFTVLMIFLGLYNALLRIRILIWGGISCLALYVVISPIITSARLSLEDRTDKGLQSRYQMMEEGMIDREDVRNSNSDVQFWWTRLNYANVQTYGRQSYDAGRGGTSLENAFYSFIPRWLWPDKPVQTFGADLNEILLHSRKSQMGIGIFGEAYWNGGWVAVLLISVLTALELSGFTYLSLKYISARDYRWVPCGVLGIRAGVRPDDWFVTIYVGIALICVCFYSLVFMTIPPPKPARK